MYRPFTVRWEGVLPGDAEQAWEAITAHTSAWLWRVDYEPREGGREQGLSPSGGTVTVWEPPTRFQTRAEQADGWYNQLDYTFEPHPDGTLLQFQHTSMLPPAEYDVEYDACVQHTDFYYHSLTEYLGHFAGRDAAYVSIEPSGSFEEACKQAGISDNATVGDQVTLATGEVGTITYRTPAFVGVRTEDAIVRLFGREAWNGPVDLTLHLFAANADAKQAKRSWKAAVAPSEAVA